MNAENPSCLGFIVAGGRQDLFDVVVFQLPQTQKLVSGRRNVRLGKRLTDFLLKMPVANLFRKMADVDLAFRGENHGAPITFLNSRMLPGQGYCSSKSAAAGVNPVKLFFRSRLSCCRISSAKGAMSSLRSRRGGICNCTTFMR